MARMSAESPVTVFGRLHEEIFLLRAECDSLRVRLKSSERALQETRKKLMNENKAHGRAKARLLDLESALVAKRSLEENVASLRSENAKLAASLASERSSGQSMASLLESSKAREREYEARESEYEARIKSLDLKMTGMSVLTEKCMERIRTASSGLARGLKLTSALVTQHSQEVSELFAFNSRDVHEAVSRTFKQLIVPVDVEFHRQLFGAGREGEEQHPCDDESVRDAVMDSIWELGDYGVYESSLRKFCSKESPLWVSLRRGLMDFWKVNSWDLMQQSTHNLLQMLSIFFEARIANASASASSSDSPSPSSSSPSSFSGGSSSPGPHLCAYRDCFCLPRIPAVLPSGPETTMKILNRLEMVSSRLGSPWHSNCKLYMEREHCSSLSHDAPSRFFLASHGVHMFDIGCGIVFRFATIPDGYRRLFVSQGYTMDDLWRVQSSVCKGGVRVRRSDAPPAPLRTHNIPCMHTADAIDTLNNMIDTSDMGDDGVRAAFLLRITNQFVLTMPHIAITKLMVAYRNEMMEKHKRAVLDLALTQLREASETLGVSVRTNNNHSSPKPVLDFHIPSVNLPARAIHVPPIVKFMLVHKFRKGVTSHLSAELGRSLNLSRGIRMRAYVNYHDEPNLGAMDEMEPWMTCMERNRVRGHTEDAVESTSSLQVCVRPPNFKFAYARSICLGMYIHAFVICPAALRHHFVLTSVASEIGNVVQQSICKLLGVLPPPQVNEVTHLLWEPSYSTQMKIFFDDVRDSVHRAMKSDYLVMFASRGSKADDREAASGSTHPKFS
jgi:hypothetical protein